MFPSLNEKSTNSSPLLVPVLTIPPSTFAFLAPSAPPSFEMSGRDSVFRFFAAAAYIDNINKIEEDKILLGEPGGGSVG